MVASDTRLKVHYTDAPIYYHSLHILKNPAVSLTSVLVPNYSRLKYICEC